MGYQYPQPNQVDIASIFRAVDVDFDGEINGNELQSALANGTHTSFNPSTINLMIQMFDVSGRGRVGMREFGSLFNYVEAWKRCFLTFDRDGSGGIDGGEFHSALATFGYTLSPQLTSLILAKYDRHKRGTLAFDDFIQACLILHMLTNGFREYDGDRDGWIRISYEQFLNLALQLPI